MVGTAATGAVGAHAMRFTDADEYRHAIRNADIEYIPLAPGPFEAKLTVSAVGNLPLQRGVDGAHVTRGAVAADRAALLVALAPAPGITHTFNNFAPDDTDGCLLAAGAEFQSIWHGPQTWAALSFPAGELQALTGEDDHRMGVRLLRLPAARHIGRSLMAIADLAESMVGPFGCPDFRETLASGLRDVVMEAAQATGPTPRDTPRATAEVLRLLNVAEEFLRLHITRPIFLNDLCTALSVSPRKLHQVFIAACGISPQAYLKRRRLMMVRRALRSGSPDSQLVKSVALGHGFWHLGNFAREYRDMFGELPSDTLVSTRSAGQH